MVSSFSLFLLICPQQLATLFPASLTKLKYLERNLSSHQYVSPPTWICSQNYGFSCYSGWTCQGYSLHLCAKIHLFSLSKYNCSNSPFITGSILFYVSILFSHLQTKPQKKHFHGSIFFFSSHPVSPKACLDPPSPVFFCQLQRYSPSPPPKLPFLTLPSHLLVAESNGHSSVLILLKLSLVFSS